MNLVVIFAIVAVCGAANLDRTYLPPSSAGTAGGSPGSLQAPLTRSSVQGLEGPKLPTGSYTNDFGGVVVDAAGPGTRASANEDLSGLGAPRPTYGSTDSKVGEAAFRGSVAEFQKTPAFGPSQTDGRFDNPGQGLSNTQIDTHAGQFPSNGQIGSVGNQAQFSSNDQISQSFQGFDENRSERPQAAKDRNSNILALSNNVNSESYSYGFETDNGIAVGENGVAINGVQAEGGYSYQGDDGQVYKVTYTADEGGYRPQGDHLPTPPPIPEEILKSLEQNAKEEAAGLVDDGSYDAQKYNTDGDYTHDNGGNIQYNGAQLSQIGKRPDATDSTFINQNGQTFPKPGVGQFGIGSSQNNLGSNGQSIQTNGQLGATASNSDATFNGQFNQVNRKPTGQFGLSGSFNGQSSLNTGKPGQIGFTGLQSTSNHQSSQMNGQASAQFGSGNQNTHGSFSEQFSQASGNKFGSQFASALQSTSQSHSSQSPSGHQENSGTGQAFGHSAGNQFSSTSGQGAFGNQAQFGSQQASASSQFENQSPDLEFQQNQQSSSSSSQFGSRPTKPGFDQNAGSSSFNSQSAQPHFGSSFKPQGSEAFSGASLNKEQDNQDFGKPSPQIFSGQNFNRPSAGNFNFKKPTSFGSSKFGSSTFKQFTQTSGQFEAKNEYLPPGNFNGQKPGNSQGFAQSFNSNSQETAEKEQTPDIVSFNGPKPGFSSASASTSFKQPAKPLNSFNTVSQSKPNQFTQTNQFSSNNPVEFSSSSQQSGSFSQSTPNFSSKPTSIPDTELTTPLEPEEKPASSQSSQFPSQAKPSFSSFDSKPASNNHEQIQFGFQGNSAFGLQSTSQTMSQSFPTSSPQYSSQFDSSPSQAFQSSVSKPVNANDKSQFSHNNFGQNQQNQPSFSQGVDNSYYYNQPSKPFHSSEVRPHGSRFPSSSSDQSDGVASQSQQSSFHSSGKFTGSLTPVSPTSATQFTQTQGYNGITQAAISPFPSTPTPSQLGTQSQFGSKPTFNQQSTFNTAQPSQPSFNQQSTFNSQFTSSGSLQSKPKFPQSGQPAFPSRPISQFGQKPLSGSQTLTQLTQSGPLDQSENTPVPTEGSPQQQTTVTQQYQGPIYEYNKPAEVLPAPSQTDSSSSQTIQAGVTSELKPFSKSQGNQLPTQQDSKPFSQSSSVSSNNQFRPNTQTVHRKPSLDSGIGSQFGSQSVKPLNVPSLSSIQFGQNADKAATTFGTSSISQISQTAQSTPDSSISMSLQQNTQGSKQPFKPFGASQGIQSSFGSKAHLSQTTQFSQNTQSLVNSQAFQPNRGSSQTQFGSQTFGNAASGQQNGYFYPENPKPQFQTPDIAKNRFTQNSQSGRPQAGLNQINHISQNTQNQFGRNSQTSGPSPFKQHSSQTQFNSAPKPQFGTQSTQFSQNTQAQFGHKTPDTPTQPGQSLASSQAIASGQAIASASASSSPQYKPFGSQNKHQFGQPGTPERQDQSGQGTQVGTQSLKPFESNSQEPDADSFKPYGALNSKPVGNAQSVGASKPLFSSACCKPSKDSTPAQSTNNPSQSSFHGTQNFNGQSFAGKGEEFGGPRQPPSFDQTGYHY